MQSGSCVEPVLDDRVAQKPDHAPWCVAASFYALRERESRETETSKIRTNVQELDPRWDRVRSQMR